MNIKMRIEVERLIIGAFIRQAIKAGYRLTVSLDRGYDIDEESPVLGITDPKALIAEAMAGDEAHIFVHAAEGPLLVNGALNSIGWVYVVLGNDGWDVISDYTCNLEDLGLMTEADKVAKRYEPA